MRACLFAAFLLSPGTNGFAPTSRVPLNRQLAVRRAVTPLQSDTLVRPRRSGAVFASAAAAPAPAAPARSVVARRAGALLCTAATLLLTACRALAVTAAKTAADADLVITGGMVKWGGVGLVFGAAYLFKREEKPIISYVDDDDEPPKPRKAPAAPGRAAASSLEVDSAEPSEAAALDTSDNAMISALNARMFELAKERLEEKDDEPPAKPDDSTDEWGMGNTAVLEPPRPSDGIKDAGIEFPVGFPLRDFEPEPIVPEEVTPTASADEIAMLERMFGTKPPGA